MLTKRQALVISVALIALVVGNKGLTAGGINVNAKDKYGDTALIRAAMKGDVPRVKALLTAGADVNAKNNVGNTALMKVAGNGHGISIVSSGPFSAARRSSGSGE